MSNKDSNCQGDLGNSFNHGSFNETAAAGGAPARTHALRAPDGRTTSEAELDTPPTNRVSNKYSDTFFKLLRYGVDSLYLSFRGQLDPDQQERLETLKKLAQSDQIKDQSQAQIVLKGHVFEVMDKGTKFFPYILEDNCFRIQLSRGTNKSMPMAYVKISSDYLSHTTPQKAADALYEVLLGLGTVERVPKTSRIDLFVDFASDVDMESWKRDAWVTRTREIHQYSVDGQFTGWTVGLGGDIGARLYNKILEIMISNKAYLVPLWNQAGWDGQTPIWRLEFELKRDLLKQFKFPHFNNTLADFNATLHHLNGLWSYATTEWLKLCIPSQGDSNRSRWDIHPLWQCVASVDFEANDSPIKRDFSAQRIPSDKRLFDHGFSVLTSYMAREGVIDFGEGAKRYVAALNGYVVNRAADSGSYFDNFVHEHVALKAKRFNSILNKFKQAEPSREELARAYRMARDGDDGQE